MSTEVADVVGAHLAGQQRASLLLDHIRRDTAHPDALDVELAKISDSHERRGLLRAIQKHLQRVVE